MQVLHFYAHHQHAQQWNSHHTVATSGSDQISKFEFGTSLMENMQLVGYNARLVFWGNCPGGCFCGEQMQCLGGLFE